VLSGPGTLPWFPHPGISPLPRAHGAGVVRAQYCHGPGKSRRQDCGQDITDRRASAAVILVTLMSLCTAITRQITRFTQPQEQISSRFGG
jgi:hypothetical protein